MPQSPRTNTALAIVETLLNSLSAERHMRLALLDTVVAEARATPGLEVAAGLATTLRQRLDETEIDEAEFESYVREMRVILKSLGDRAPLESRPRLVPDDEPSSA